MHIAGEITFDAPRDRVFAAFTNPSSLQRATPGIQRMTQVADDQFEAVLKVGVAGITGTYVGSLNLAEKEAPAHYKLNIAGQGSAGVVNGSGVFDFAEVDGATLVRYAWEIQVGGLLAGTGQRVLSGVGKLLLGQFMKAMEKEITAD